ncbi:MAG: hypothetical protein ACI8X5_000936, partial [Planctomycetota bacterium]
YGEAEMEITNKTKRPLRVPLPGGKKLHLAVFNVFRYFFGSSK